MCFVKPLPVFLKTLQTYRTFDWLYSFLRIFKLTLKLAGYFATHIQARGRGGDR